MSNLIVKKTDRESETSALLRLKAEELIKKKTPKTVSHLSEADTLKLIHEIEVHQIDLELQNEELTAAAEESTYVYNFAPSAYFTLSKAGEIIRLNFTAAKMLGKERQSLLTSMFGFFVSGDTRPIYNSFLDKIFTSKTKENCNLILSTDGNHPIYVHIEGVVAEKGTKCYLTVIDLTERKQSEEALRKSELRFRSIALSANDAIITANNKGIIRDWNRGAEIIFGYTEGEAIGKSLTIIIPKRYVEKHINGMNRIAQGGEKHVLGNTVELSGLHKNGNEFPIEISLAEWETSEGKFFTGIVRDITERKQAELLIQQQNNQLKEINATKDKLFSIIAHDLRSPFTGLLGITEVLATNDKEYTSSEIAKYTSALHHSAVNIYKLLENLLEWAQLQGGSISYTPIDLSLFNVFMKCKESIKQSALQKQIAILNEIPESTKIFTDEKMISSLLRNLLTNAIKFSNKGGKITTTAIETDGGMIQISVTDTGVGIPASIVPKLFKVGEKVGSMGTEGEQSTGLGLLLCKEFVEKHGGKIWVESEEGKGSTFRFSLPKAV